MSAPTLKPEEPMSLDRFTRTARGQELLDRAQEVRAIKREKDAVWPVLDAAEAIAAAATVVESGPNPVPALAERLRRSVDLLLDTTAAAGELSLEITKREILADFWKGRRATPEPPAQRAEVPASADSVVGRFRAAMDGVQCACSVRERDSGHRVGCEMPEAREAAERLVELLVEMAREHQAACALAKEANDRVADLLNRTPRTYSAEDREFDDFTN